MSTKKADVEVLVLSMLVKEEGSIVRPVNCPGKGRSNEILKDDEYMPVCVFMEQTCPFFRGAYMNIQTQDKTLNCAVIMGKQSGVIS